MASHAREIRLRWGVGMHQIHTFKIQPALIDELKCRYSYIFLLITARLDAFLEKCPV